MVQRIQRQHFLTANMVSLEWVSQLVARGMRARAGLVTCIAVQARQLSRVLVRSLSTTSLAHAVAGDARDLTGERRSRAGHAQ